MNKNELRERYLVSRRDIKDKEKKSIIICKRILSSQIYKDASIIALYKSMNSEVDTEYIISDALTRNKLVVLPRVNKNTLDFYQIESLNDKFERSNFGVDEPLPDSKKLVDKDKIDLVIIPGVCFDTFGNRIGYGKGYYDSFLKNSKFFKIAICFDEQIVRKMKISSSSYDIKMDQIITDKEELIFKKNKRDG